MPPIVETLTNISQAERLVSVDLPCTTQVLRCFQIQLRALFLKKLLCIRILLRVLEIAYVMLFLAEVGGSPEALPIQTLPKT
jgi:hypothetical protein